MILQHEAEQTHLLSDILAQPKFFCDTHPPGKAGNTEIWTFTWKGGSLYREWVKQAVATWTGNWKMGANLKLDILVHNKTEVKGNLFQQVEPQSHAGEKTSYDSLGSHITIIQNTFKE